MSGKWLDINGPVLANTVYVGGKLAAKDTSVTLPEITFSTAEFKAAGPLTMPIYSQIENMETTIHKGGTDLGLLSMLKLGPKTIEARFAVDVLKSDGTTTAVGAKAFLRVIPNKIPGITGEPGSPIESDLTFTTTRYQFYVNGEEYWLIDKLAQKVRVGGVDYYDSLSRLL